MDLTLLQRGNETPTIFATAVMVLTSPFSVLMAAMTMTTIPDLIFVVLFAIVAPIIDYSIFWPAHRRLSQAEPAWTRTWLWAWTIGNQWTLAAFGVALWIASGRSPEMLGLTVPVGWRLWASLAMLLLLAVYQGWAIKLLASSGDQRASLRQQVISLTDVLPHSQTELQWFCAVSLTAGFCEEFLYRGYFIWVFSPWVGWCGSGSDVLAILRRLRTSIRVGTVYLEPERLAQSLHLVFAVSESLWPAIALHALVDLGSGTMAWLALREKPNGTSGA